MSAANNLRNFVNKESRHGSSKRQRYVLFEAKPSPYDELTKKSENCRIFHDVCMAQIGLFCLAMICSDSLAAGRLRWDWSHIVDGWGSAKDIGRAVLCEMIMVTLAMAVYPLFKLWMVVRRVIGKLADLVFILAYIGMVIASFPGAILVSQYFHFAGFLNATFATEQLRMVVKSYSFIRENAYKVLYPWNKDDQDGPAVWYRGQISPNVGSFRQYSYFLFCPTLLYRDHYPRTPGNIRWDRVAVYFTQFLASLYVGETIYRRFLTLDSLKYSDIVQKFFTALPLGLVELVSVHFGTVHAMMNFGGELTRFADRQFYTEWWTSHGYGEFYRKWNNVVHHFLHQYLYRDFKHLTPAAILFPIFISSIIHEYIMFMGTGFILPILTGLFCTLGVLVFFWPFQNARLQNISTLFCLCVGFCMIFFAYLIEETSRQLCPREETLIDVVLPRSIECLQKYNH